ncbi:hypothetical protein EB796_019405 [Bugula neritina]|uniref:C-type lectin domain-containing protein n=1 Tax=Bugula neritina TaxID=10212 RepID=A0A7J7J7W4_BUGNE|nr:hypothetical protein EB796_019405 [Bugula neritina]
MWFGGRKYEGTWFWMDKSTDAVGKISYFDWRRGEPNGYGYRRNVAECLNIYNNGQMDDDWCDQKHAYACEKSVNDVVVG